MEILPMDAFTFLLMGHGSLASKVPRCCAKFWDGFEADVPVGTVFQLGVKHRRGQTPSPVMAEVWAGPVTTPMTKVFLPALYMLGWLGGGWRGS